MQIGRLFGQVVEIDFHQLKYNLDIVNVVFHAYSLNLFKSQLFGHILKPCTFD